MKMAFLKLYFFHKEYLIKINHLEKQTNAFMAQKVKVAAQKDGTKDISHYYTT